MHRRDFVALLGSAVVVWPLVALGQDQSRRVFRLMWMSSDQDETRWRAPIPDAILMELARRGYVEGRNLELHRYFFPGRSDPATLTRELGYLRPDVIYASDGRQVRALRAATITIPIVASVLDPVGQGFAVSLARPGGNVTGTLPDAGQGVMVKRLQFLKEVRPTAARIGFVAPRYSFDGPYRHILAGVAQRLGVEILGPPVESPYGEADYQRVFAAMAQDRADAFLIGDSIDSWVNRRQLVDLVAKAGLAAVYPYRDFATLGGLMAYTQDFTELGRHSASQIDEIFSGEHPGNIPFYQGTKFNFVVNLKTAAELGFVVPSSLLTLADEVIE